ncbi:hypothetical protein [Arcobacter sp. YIC-310]|uniref:hypothetical protein n=1 Tax=Arcobacter sp. YIC-310 TaxID=3376632 RepID=UPI003C1F5E98
MNFDELLIALIMGLITSIVGAYIYDNLIRNSDYEPAYLFNEKFSFINKKRTFNVDDNKRVQNRSFFYNLFFIVFSLFLLWGALYGPFLFKAGFLNSMVDLSNSNIVNILGLSKEYLVFKIEPLKWVCLGVAFILLFPTLYVGTKFSQLFINVKDHFYEVNQKDWDIFRMHGVLCFIVIILALNVYFVSTLTLFKSFIISASIVLALLANANKR